MKTLVTAIALTAALSTPALAESNHEHQHSSDMAGGNTHRGTMMPMMHKEHMKQMQEHMQEMHKLMADIKQEKSPEERHQLMQKHMKSMEKGMHTMMGKREGTHDMKEHKDMSSVQMQERMEMMEDRMEMMQMMMEQVVQHKAEDKKHRKH